MTSPSGTHQMEQPLLKEGGVALDVLVGCNSNDCDSVRSDVADAYVIVSVSASTNRRKRKMLQPRRAAMYGSGAGGGEITIDSKDRPGPQQDEHQQAISNHQNIRADLLAPSAPTPMPGAPKTHKSAGNKRAKNSKKQATTALQHGPCDHCSATTSPQWRHGTTEKPIVCNACGIRYGRTGSFNKALTANKKRTASSAAISGSGKRRNKRAKTASVDAWQEDGHEGTKKPARRILTAIKRRSPTLGDITTPPTTSPCDSPVSTGTMFDASTPPSPLRLDDFPAAAAAGGMQTSGACSPNPYNAAQQQQVLHTGRAVGQTTSRLGPSPLGRVSATGAPVAGAATLTNLWAVHSAPIAGAEYISTPGSSPPMAVPAAAGEAHPAAIATGAAAPSVPAFQPEFLDWVNKLASGLGSEEAAVAFLNTVKVTFF